MARPNKQTPVMPGQLDLLDIRDTLRTAPCVPLVRQEVKQWQAAGYAGITATTRRLLAWWFKNDHRLPNGSQFRYHTAQREAIETLIYLHEVKGIRTRSDLLLAYAKGQKIALPMYDPFARYAVKMGTGSGKTKVMALALAWQYFNAVRGEGDHYATTFLLIAPNIIVLERLVEDFAGGKVFKADPVIPPEYDILWDFDVYLRGEGERMQSAGALYVTNIQQLYEKPEDTTPLNPVEDLLGPVPPSSLQPEASFLDRIARRGDCLVLNDEAHHTNDGAVVWNTVISTLHERLGARGLTAQLDFSATPRQADGTLFTWTVYDYPLKQAILDNVVKRPVKGIAQGIGEVQSDNAAMRYEAYLVAAVERWQEYRTELGPLGKKPILFLMLYDTKSADQVAEWLRHKYPNTFDGDKLLVIHTNTKGDITTADVDKARKAARDVDSDASETTCIVSVLMLREGWDVNNVTVVVGLRPFMSKADILPEQAVGRGLRLMFRNLAGYQERVDVIGNGKFMEVVERLEREEGIKLDTFEYGKKKTPLIIPTIQVETERIPARDIAISVLSPRLERKKSVRQVIESVDVRQIALRQPLRVDTATTPTDTFTYEGRDVISDEVVVTRTYTMPQAQTASEIIAFYTQIITQALKLTAQFATLVPKVEQFLREKAFGAAVNLDSKPVIQALSRPLTLALTEKVFFALIRPRLTDEAVPVVDNAPHLLSTTPPFPYSGKVADVKHTLFNLTPCGNDFEQAFARFLDGVFDVETFANLGNLPRPLQLEYLDGEANLRLYEPDFVARDNAGRHWLLETKGREDLDVARKDARAEQWCADVTALAGAEWHYRKVPQKEFERIKPQSLAELVSVLDAGGSLFV
jgi:type III restriction enzyme